jgi:hypothetical protein
MSSPASRTTFHPIIMTLAAIVAAIVVTLPTPASAVDGRTAVGICIDSTASGARCAWSVNDKGEIDICNASGCVFCPSATDQCSVARSRPRPPRSLPVGTSVNTPMGSFQVTQRSFNFKSLCPRGQIRCPLMGCVPIGECDFQK